MDKKIIGIKKIAKSPRVYDNMQTAFKFRRPNCKFSRAERFTTRRISIGGEFTSIPTCIGKGRKTSFGFGRRYSFKNPGGDASPPCNTYTIPSCFDKITGGLLSPLNKDHIKRYSSIDLRFKNMSYAGHSTHKNRFSTNVSIFNNTLDTHDTPRRKSSLH
jgi:hypothetical protein